jgi:hypothetical protein
MIQTQSLKASNLPELEIKFIQELTTTRATSTLDEIDIESWQHIFKTWQESTWTSQLRLHLSYFKSLVVTPHH